MTFIWLEPLQLSHSQREATQMNDFIWLASQVSAVTASVPIWNAEYTKWDVVRDQYKQPGFRNCFIALKRQNTQFSLLVFLFPHNQKTYTFSLDETLIFPSPPSVQNIRAWESLYPTYVHAADVVQWSTYTNLIHHWAPTHFFFFFLIFNVFSCLVTQHKATPSPVCSFEMWNHSFLLLYSSLSGMSKLFH